MESAFAALKMYRDCIRCRRQDNRTREISILTICYNIELVARSQAKEGRFTGPNRNTRSVTGASDHASFLAESLHHALDLSNFMGCGGTMVQCGLSLTGSDTCYVFGILASGSTRFGSAWLKHVFVGYDPSPDRNSVFACAMSGCM